MMTTKLQVKIPYWYFCPKAWKSGHISGSV